MHIARIIAIFSLAYMISSIPSPAQQLDLPHQTVETQGWSGGMDKVYQDTMYQDVAKSMMGGRPYISEADLVEAMKERPAAAPIIAGTGAAPEWSTTAWSNTNWSPQQIPVSPGSFGSAATVSAEVVAFVNTIGDFVFHWSTGETTRAVTLKKDEYRTLDCGSSCQSGSIIRFQTLNVAEPIREVSAVGGETYTVRYQSETGWTVAKVGGLRYVVSESGE